MTITYRLVKGSPLTFAEEDGNFSDLDGRVEALEDLTFANPIDAITVSGNQMTFHYTTAAGGGSDTVTIPTAQWKGRGNWLPSTNYAVNDLVIDSSNLYLVQVAHLSATSFDPGEQIGGQNVYQFIFGPLGQTQTLTLTTISYTLQGTDNLKYYRCTAFHTAGIVIIIPDDVDVTIPIDSEVTFRQCADHLIFQADTGVALNVPAGHHATTDHIGAVVTLKKVAVDQWDIFGALALGT
jgi:hypothetical protein